MVFEDSSKFVTEEGKGWALGSGLAPAGQQQFIELARAVGGLFAALALVDLAGNLLSPEALVGQVAIRKNFPDCDAKRPDIALLRESLVGKSFNGDPADRETDIVAQHEMVLALLEWLRLIV